MTLDELLEKMHAQEKALKSTQKKKNNNKTR
jgi:hypothetical protein